MKMLRGCLAVIAMFFGMIILLIFLMMMATNAMLSSIPDVPMPT